MTYESPPSKDDEPNGSSVDPAPLAGNRPSGLRQRITEQIWPRWKPRFWQTWLNLQVWVPFLQNPNTRARQILYWGREHREGHSWRIALPAVCWHCGRTEGLRSREYDVDIRSFEYALQLAVATAGSALLVLLLALWMSSWKLLLFALLLVGGGIGVILIKSWHERVRLVMWTCREHGDTMKRPDLVIDDNQLHVIMPTETLAGAAQEELNAERRRLATLKGAGSTGTSASYGSGGAMGTAPAGEQHRPAAGAADGAPPPVYKPAFNTPNAPELPPIKLFGDDEEAEQK